MKAHQIENGVVVNTILVDDLDVFPGLIDAALGGKIGDAWDGVKFTAPAPPAAVVPAEVTMRQARLALLGAGMLGQVNTALAAMSGAQGEAARIEWEFSSAVMRGQPLVAALAPILGMTDADLDQLFIAAGAL